MQERWNSICEDLPEEEIATRSSTLAWETPWTEETGRVQSMGSQRVGHNWVTEHACYITRPQGQRLGREEALLSIRSPSGHWHQQLCWSAPSDITSFEHQGGRVAVAAEGDGESWAGGQSLTLETEGLEKFVGVGLLRLCVSRWF